MSDIIPNLEDMTDAEKKAALDAIQLSIAKSKEVQKQRIGENVNLVIDALKKIESDIQSRYDLVGNTLEKRVASIKDGKDGKDGRDGKNGKDGRDGKQGVQGAKGENGRDGRDGVDGSDGVGVSFARIDFDGSLVIGLSSGVELNVGEVVAPDLAERIKVITNGGGTSQSVLDTLASLQTQINNLIPSQTGNAGKYLTTNGTVLSWASIAGGGLSYQGTWNASTNIPTLVSSTGVNGYYYITSTAGSTNLDGITDWQIGDWLIFNGTVWQKIDQSNLVTSVNGQTGAVSVGTVTSVAATAGTGITVSGSPITSSGTLTITNTAPDQTVVLTAGTGINTSGTYPSFTIANSAPDQTVVLTAGTGINTSGTYPNFTVTNSAPDQTVALTQGGTTTITGTYPNFSISSADQFQGTVTSVTGTSPVASSGGAAPDISLSAGYGDTLNPYASKTANFVLAAPDSSAGVPTFRAVVAADIPTLNQNTTGSAATVTTTIDSGAVATTQTAGDNSTKVATTAYVNAVTGTDGITGFKNRIINGAMVIDQRNAGASVSAINTALFPVDRYYVLQAIASSKFTAQQSSTVPTGFTKSVVCTSSSAYTVLSSDYFLFRQIIEGFNVADLGWGAAGAQTVTLSFWVRSSLTGAFGGALGNGASNRSYPFSYTINAADTWEQKTITIAGDTSGTWATDNSAGVVVNWSIGMGSTYKGTANAWAGSFLGAPTGSVDLVATNGATFYITGVQLEKGSTATSFDYRPYGTELALCQRYLTVLGGSGTSGNNYYGIGLLYSTNDGLLQIPLPVVMRSAPTFSFSSLANWSMTMGTVGAGVLTAMSLQKSNEDMFTLSTSGTSGGLTTNYPFLLVKNSTASRMYLSAEL